MENSTEISVWNMEDQVMPEWNDVEGFKNGMEDSLPYQFLNFILNFVHVISRKYLWLFLLDNDE